MPNVKKAAAKTVAEARQQVLEQHVPKAIKRLRSILASDGAADRDVINAAKALLAAAGMTGGGVQVDVNVQTAIDIQIQQAGSARDLLLSRFMMMQSAKGEFDQPCCPTCGAWPSAQRKELPVALPSAGVQMDADDVVDAEVVEFPSPEPE